MKCKLCNKKLEVFSVQGGFCSFKCRNEYKKLKEKAEWMR